jgi:hypothetical protein
VAAIDVDPSGGSGAHLWKKREIFFAPQADCLKLDIAIRETWSKMAT